MSKIVQRTLDFLELFGEERRPLALSEIARLLDLPVSSSHDVLQALEDRGYIYEVAPRSGYYPTLRLRDLVDVIAQNDPIVARAEPTLQKLRDTVDESIFLCKTNGHQAIYLLCLKPSHSLIFVQAVGERVRSLTATSAGKAQLGSWKPQEFQDYLKTGKLDALTPKSITTKDALRKDVEAGRERGWYTNFEESQLGVVSLSAFFKFGPTTGIVTIAGPASRMEPKVDWLAEQLLSASNALGSLYTGGDTFQRSRRARSS